MPPAPHLPAADAADHAARIVALDAGDLSGADRTAAESLVGSCGGCAALADDLLAIRGAMTALPVPPRRRDYRLTAEDAARLRPSGWRRLIEWLAAPGSTVRPLATGLATLGLTGLLLSSGVPGMLTGFGSAGGAPAAAPAGSLNDAAGGGSGSTELQGRYTLPAASGAPDSVASSVPGLAATPAPMPAATPGGAEAAGVAGEAATAEPPGDRAASTGASGATDGDAENAKAGERDAGSSAPLPVVASLALLVAGLVLFAGRAFARRPVS